MEDKVKREGRTFIEKLFRKHDQLGCGAIARNDMRKIMENLKTGFNDFEELEDKIDSLAKTQKYTAPNPKTKQLEVKYLEDALDFPSTLAIAVSFLQKDERRNTDAFMGKGLISFADMPRVTATDLSRRDHCGKKRLF